MKVIPHGKYTARLSVGGQGSTNTPHKSRRHRTSETQNQVDLTTVQKKKNYRKRQNSRDSKKIAGCQEPSRFLEA